MTREQFSILVKGMKAIYSDPKFISDKDAFDVWYTFFADDDYMVVQAAIQKYMANNEFAPTVAGIRKNMVDITEANNEMSEAQAWAMVYKAICNANYGAVEEFNKLPEAVQIAVGNHENLREWAMLPTDEVNTVIQSNFMRGYRTAKKRQAEFASLPCQVREQILKITGGTHTPLINKEVEEDV